MVPLAMTGVGLGRVVATPIITMKSNPRAFAIFSQMLLLPLPLLERNMKRKKERENWMFELTVQDGLDFIV